MDFFIQTTLLISRFPSLPVHLNVLPFPLQKCVPIKRDRLSMPKFFLKKPRLFQSGLLLRAINFKPLTVLLLHFRSPSTACLRASFITVMGAYTESLGLPSPSCRYVDPILESPQPEDTLHADIPYVLLSLKQIGSMRGKQKRKEVEIATALVQ